MRNALQLRGLIANQHQRIAWLGVVLDEYPTDCLPQNFHAQCVLARQQLRSFEEELAALSLAPAAPHQATTALLVTVEAQPATLLQIS